MGPPAPIPIDACIDSPKSGQTLWTPRPAYLFADARSPATSVRAPSWLGGQCQSRLSRLQQTPGLTAHSASHSGGSEQDAWSSLWITGASPVNSVDRNYRSQVYQTVACTGDKPPISPLSVPSQNSQAFTSELGCLPSDSGYGTRTLSTESVPDSRLMDIGKYTRHTQHNSTTSTQGHGTRPSYPQLSDNDSRGQPVWPNPSLAPPDAPLEQQQVCDLPDCNWTGRCPSDKK